MKKIALLAALLAGMALPAAAATSATSVQRISAAKGISLSKGGGAIGSVSPSPAPKRPSTKAVTAPVKPKRK